MTYYIKDIIENRYVDRFSSFGFASTLPPYQNETTPKSLRKSIEILLERPLDEYQKRYIICDEKGEQCVSEEHFQIMFEMFIYIKVQYRVKLIRFDKIHYLLNKDIKYLWIVKRYISTSFDIEKYNFKFNKTIVHGKTSISVIGMTANEFINFKLTNDLDIFGVYDITNKRFI